MGGIVGEVPPIAQRATAAALALMILSYGVSFIIRGGGGAQVFSLSGSGTMAISGALVVTGQGTGSCIQLNRMNNGGASCCFVDINGTTFTCLANACSSNCD